MEDMETFKISGVGSGKEGEEDKGGIDVTAVITYKTPFVVNGQQVTVSFALGEGVACNTIFSYPFLYAIKGSVLTESNTLVSGMLGETFRLELMIPPRAREAPKTVGGMPTSLVARGSQKEEKEVEVQETVLHKRHMPGQH